MRKVILTALLAVFVCGCGSFGTFTSVKRGKTSKTQITEMMGEPASIQHINGTEIWKYQFVEAEGNHNVIMDFGITFKGDMVKNYQVRTSKVLRKAPSPSGRKKMR